MGQNGTDMEGAEEKEEECEFSMYSDDSYEYVRNDLSVRKWSTFNNYQRLFIPKLDFNELPDYETTEEDEEEQVTPPRDDIVMNSPRPTAQMVPYNSGTPTMKEK